MQVSKITFFEKLNTSNYTRTQSSRIEAGRTYQNVPSFWGRDLVNKSQTNPLPQEILAVMPKNISIQEIISHAQSEENKLGQGANSVVYNIPQLNGYVLKVLNKDDPNKVDLKEFPSGVNLGQPIWQDDKNPRILILKKIEGKEHSISNWSRTIGEHLQVTTKQAQQFAVQLSQIAQMPQKAFDQLASDVKLLDDKGYKLDSINPNNLIVDSENSEIHIIDYFKVKPRETDLYRNSCFDLISVMCDFTLFPEYYDKLSVSEKQSLMQSSREIADKVYLGAKKADLSCSIGRYITYINETSKWFPVSSVKDENINREYVRTYSERMNDFINMLTAPKHWVEKR